MCRSKSRVVYVSSFPSKITSNLDSELEVAPSRDDLDETI